MKHKRLIAGLLMLGMLIVCAAIIGVSWVSVSQAQEVGFRWDLFPGGQVSDEADEEKHLTVSGPITLRVKNSMGDITITQGVEGEISLAAHKTAWGATQAEAEAALARLQVEITQEQQVITVQVEQKEVSLFNQDRNDSVDFTITVPAETAVTAQTGFGNVELSGVTGQADLRSDYGYIAAADVKGGLLAPHSQRSGHGAEHPGWRNVPGFTLRLW